MVLSRHFCTLIAALITTSWITVFAQENDPYPPGPVPDRIILTWSDDPATTQSVTWRTDMSVTRAWAEIALALPGPDFRLFTDTTMATTTALKSNNNLSHYHSVTFTGLKSNTQYAYRVGDGNKYSEWFHFKTAAGDEEPISFMYFGDAQNALKSLWSRCIRQGYSTLPDIDFILHAGDLINIADKDEEWGEWFYAAGWINGMRSNIPSPGNHEYYNTDKTRALSSHWNPTFTLPENGPEGLRETVYYIDYQGLRIISLNTMAAVLDENDLTKQLVWLENVLKDNPNKWTIITQHHPIYSTARNRDNPKLRTTLQPLFEQYGVDLVLQGHDHSYGRGHNLVYGETHRDKGPVYVVSVSGPKMYVLNFEDWLDRAAANTQLYQLVHIDENNLRYEAYTTTGDLYDAFSLKKRRNGTNKFIDQSNECTAERLEIPPGRQAYFTEEELKEYRSRFEAYKLKKGIR